MYLQCTRLENWVLSPVIWTTSSAVALPGEGSDAERQEVSETARHKWLTCRARADCWVEEKDLLQEEMRRVVVYLEWKFCFWSEKVGSCADSSTPDIQCGVDAYARKQAHIHCELAILFAEQWLPYLNACNFDTRWVTVFPWASRILPSRMKLPRWFPKPPQSTPHKPPPTDPPPGTTKELGTAQQTPGTRSEGDSCRGEDERGERSNDGGKDPSDQDNHEDDEDEAYYSEDDDDDWHEVDGNNNTNSTDEFGFEYDDDYMS